MNFHILAKFLGALLLLVSIAMSSCGVFAWLDLAGGNEAAMRALFRSALITSGLGGLMMILGIGKIERVPRREGIVVVGLGWILCGLVGSLPYMLGQPRMEFADALFESVSGFTTTGSTVMGTDHSTGKDIESWPRGILMWRAVTQWLGGMGILVLFVALLSYLGMGSKSLFRNESSFQTGEAYTARIRDTALTLWKLYLCVTLICICGLLCLGLTPYNAIAHAFTVVSTGGFSPHNQSIGYYSSWGNGWLIELWLSIFMIICSISFMVWVVVMRKRWQRLRAEEEGKLFILIFVAASLIIAWNLTEIGGGEPMGFLTALRHSWFNVLSVFSTTGYSTVNYAAWPGDTLVLLAALMILGGCSGSTSGGVKVSRFIVLLKTARFEIVRAFRPNQVFRMHVNGNALGDSERLQTVVFLALWAFIFIASCFVVSLLEVAHGMDMISAFGAVVATIANIGPGFGSVGPADNFAHLLPVTKIFLSLLMVLGRLELYAILVLFTPTIWRKY